MQLDSLDAAPVPLYYRLRQLLRAQIQEGKMPPGSPFPTEQELMERYNVSRTTVRQAVLGLVSEGLLYRKQGKGTFVAEPKIEHELGSLTAFTEDMDARGLKASATLISAQLVTLSDLEAARMGMPPNSQAYRIERLRLADGEPMALEVTTWPLELGQRLVEENLNDTGIYALLEDKFGIVLGEADQTIEAAAASAHEAEHLGIRKGAPVLVVERVAHDAAGRAIELGRTTYRADRYSYRIRLRRRRAPMVRRPGSGTTSAPAPAPTGQAPTGTDG